MEFVMILQRLVMIDAGLAHEQCLVPTDISDCCSLINEHFMSITIKLLPYLSLLSLKLKYLSPPWRLRHSLPFHRSRLRHMSAYGIYNLLLFLPARHYAPGPSKQCFDLGVLAP